MNGQVNSTKPWDYWRDGLRWGDDIMCL